MLALILSIIFPGLGQFYYGKNKRGIAMLILALTPLYPVALVWSMIDILRLNKQGITPKFRFKEAMWSILPFVLMIPFCLFIAFSGMFVVGSWYSDRYIKPKVTLDEGKEIISALENYHKVKGKYPISIGDLVAGRPVHSRWRLDAWGEPYIYEASHDGHKFSLVSKGRDRMLGSEDDIVFE